MKVPIGNYKVVASKEGYISQVVENVEVLEEQTISIDFELMGEENMEHIIDVSITNDDEETIIVPDGIALKSYRFVGNISGNIQVGKTIELLTEDGTTTLQTQMTDGNGMITFINVVYGNYKIKINY